MSNFMLDSSGSEDEFPAVASIIRRHRSKPTASTTTTTTTTTTKVPTSLGEDDKENIPSPSSKPQLKISSMSPQKVQATPMRRRKLGVAQTQAVDGSLFQPWTGKKGGDGAEDGSRTVTKQRETSRLNTKSSRALLRRGSIESFNSSSMDTTATTTTSSKDLRRMRSRPRLEIDSDEDDEDPFARRRAKSVRPRRFRELLAARSATPNNNDYDDDDGDGESPNPNSQLQREAARRRIDKYDTTAGSSSFQTSEGGSEFNAFPSDSELFKTPPKTQAKTPGRRRLNVAKTAASVNPVEKKASRAGSRAASVALKDDPTKKRLGDQPPLDNKVVPGNAASSKGPLATKRAGLEDAFEKLKIFNDFSESDSDRQTQKPTATAMDPSTPSKKTNKALPAPSMPKTPRIPLSPWKPEQKEFWDPEVNFAWIDKHSPAKPSAPKLDFTSSAAPSNNKQASPKKKSTSTSTPAAAAAAAGAIQPVISPTKKQQREAKRAFDASKDDVARSFLAALDERVTEGKLSQLTEATGGLRTVWSNTLQTTAGRAHWKCRTVARTTTLADGSVASAAAKEAQHEAHIELASKVLTNEADLLNTVAHEFCHLVVFMLHHDPSDKNAKKPAAHGSEFKAWGRRVSAAFAHRGIEVTTKHSYDIDYKFAWRCGDCATEVQRHSRSVDPRRHRCGRCRGLLVQIKPVPRGGVPAVTGDEGSSGGEKKAAGLMKKRQPSAWQEFLAREMKELSSGAARGKEGSGGKGLSFEKKMEIVSGKWKVVRDTRGAAAKKTEKDGGGSNAGSSSSSKDITEGIKALEIEDDAGAVSATADGEEEDDDDVVVISSSSSSG